MAGWNAQAGFAFPDQYRRSLAALFNVPSFISKFLSVTGIHNYFHSFLDRFLFVAFVVSLPFIWRFNRSFFWYSVGLGLFPVLTGTFMSFTRYLSVIFPFFYVIAIGLENKSYVVLRWILLLMFVIGYFFFVIRHSAHYWVG